MPWARRHGRRYYYRSVRTGSRVRNVYLGSGPEAEAAAAEVERRKHDRVAARAATRAERDRFEEGLSFLQALSSLVDLLLLAALYAEGFRRHRRGEWRRRRHPPGVGAP